MLFYFTKALEAIDICGKMTNIRYSQMNPHRTFEEVKKLEISKSIKDEHACQKQLDDEKRIS